MFLGPTVSEKELAKALAEVLFDDQPLIRFDMSEYMELQLAASTELLQAMWATKKEAS